ncbi:hypothetical protein yc1106_03403 [Curvularia clavata]|uniref:Uncharacterized protein n=1 Tax=Curvularia clavata TaxID=95742 RepID=A0A9Q8Z773_CURCL|nr:hypothetical protein yc1106_03403 [Curvularia clavata]
MASIIAAAGHNRRWSWDEDEDDDFDLDTWKATVDTSSPSAHDLGPLQLPACEEKTENVIVDSLECHIYADKHWETPDSDMQDMAENQWPIIVSECECTSETEDEEASPEPTYTNLVDMIVEEQVAIARHEYLTHAIGLYFEGKEEADAPAYPELSPYNGHRYRYAKAFQNIKYANGRRQGEVYQHSPLVLVTSIDDAHLMDEKSQHGEYCADEYEQETLEDILGYEEEETEIEMPQVEFTVAFDENPKDANEQVKLQRLPALDHFSQDELKELIGMWKAQQDKDSEDSFEDNHEEDASSIDTWERSDIDEEEIFEPLGVECDEDSNEFSFVHPLEPEAFIYNEELDFNDVVFCGDYDIENHDEGYVSSSPPVSPVPDLFTDGGEWQKENTKASARPKGAVRVDSMDALDELGVAEESSKASACSEEENAS